MRIDITMNFEMLKNYSLYNNVAYLNGCVGTVFYQSREHGHRLSDTRVVVFLDIKQLF